jgi:hypothetical protein
LNFLLKGLRVAFRGGKRFQKRWICAAKLGEVKDKKGRSEQRGKTCEFFLKLRLLWPLPAWIPRSPSQRLFPAFLFPLPEAGYW